MPLAPCSTAKQQLKHRYAISFLLEQKHSIITDTMKKINSIPSEIRTIYTPYSMPSILCSDPIHSHTSQLLIISCPTY